MFFKSVGLIIFFALFLQCKTVETTLAVGDTVTVEAESFSLHDATVVSDKSASKGKAVEISSITSILKKEVDLPPGTYSLTVYEKAGVRDGDAIYIQVDELPPMRASTTEYGVFAPCNRTLTVCVEDDKTPVMIIITPSEIKMLVDKLVFEKLQ